MTRIEKAQQEGLTPALANAGEFKKNSDKILHEAQILAVLGEVITREGYEFADDDTYLGYARELRDHALEIIDAVKQKNYEAARKAGGQIDKACSSCHEGYRS
jgi:cytochrome c556